MTDSQPIGRGAFALWVSKIYLITVLTAASQTVALALAPVSQASDLADSTFPSIDGTGHNLDDPQMNAALTTLERKIPANYSDGSSSMAGANRKSAREISNLVHAQEDSRPNQRRTSAFVWQWGQFIDHDIDHTGTGYPVETAAIPVPANDPYFLAEIPFERSIYDETTGHSPDKPRQQLNQITGWIDGSVVYGSDEVRARALRTNDGTGKLATNSYGDLLPFNTANLPNDTGGSNELMFLAGDVRANEQIGLTALHTLFVREHNRLASAIAAKDPHLPGEMIYQQARRMVTAFLQAITYREFLPALLGRKAIPPYTGYDPSINARISNSFSTAAYRVGHSMLSTQLLRLDQHLREIPEGHLPLRSAFFKPSLILDEGGIEPVLLGLAYQYHQDIDVFIVDGVRNFLFGPPGAGGFDLAALNIQRGRDHGLPPYNVARVQYGLAPVTRFEDISSDPEIVARLRAAYEDVDQIELWVGGLAEDHEPKALVGPLFYKIIVTQFVALRDGDRFFYRNYLSRREIRKAKRTKLAHIIRRNTAIRKQIRKDVFHVRRSPKWLANAQ